MPLGDPMSIMVAGRVLHSRLIKTAESIQHVSNRIFNDMKLREGRVNDNGNDITGEGGNFTGKLDVRNRDSVLNYPISPPWHRLGS
jgi:hypothetical protein